MLTRHAIAWRLGVLVSSGSIYDGWHGLELEVAGAGTGHVLVSWQTVMTSMDGYLMGYIAGVTYVRRRKHWRIGPVQAAGLALCS